jgi:histidine triad (HIT) family protein
MPRGQDRTDRTAAYPRVRVATNACFACDTIRQGAAAEGGVIYEDDLVYAVHAHLMGRSEAYLGYLIAEPRRHVVGLGELTDAEAAALGRLVNDLAGALRAVEGAEHVYSFVFGDGQVRHLHVHLVPRYPDTPEEYRGLRVTEWPGAPRGGVDEMTAVCERLRAYFRESDAS